MPQIQMIQTSEFLSLWERNVVQSPWGGYVCALAKVKKAGEPASTARTEG